MTQAQHTTNDIKGNNKQPHVIARTAYFLNGHLEDAIKAQNGEYGDNPDLADHFINAYIRCLDANHKQGVEGSLLQDLSQS